MPPKRANFVLSANVPHVEFDILVREGLDVESDGWDGRHGLIELELVQDGGLARGIEAQHQNAHFLGPEEFAEDARDGH